MRYLAKSLQPKHIALRIRKALYALTGEDLHWVDIEMVCSQLDEDHTRALKVGLEYGRAHELLACGPLPVRSVMLTHKGCSSRARKVQEIHRESG